MTCMPVAAIVLFSVRGQIGRDDADGADFPFVHQDVGNVAVNRGEYVAVLDQDAYFTLSMIG